MEYFIGLFCIMCLLLRVFALIPILHKPQKIRDSVYYLTILDIFVYYPQWTDLYSRFSRFTAVAIYDNPAHCRILALIRHHDPRISISIPI